MVKTKYHHNHYRNFCQLKQQKFYEKYEKIRKSFTTKCTRQILSFIKSITSIQERKDIFLYKHNCLQNDDFCLFFAACIYEMNIMIDFSINYCNIASNSKQRLDEIEQKLYTCKRCHAIQCNIDKNNKEQFTPLLLAIWLKNKSSVKNLLQKNFNVNDESYPLGITPLQLACSMNWIEMIHYLIIKQHANVTKLDNFGKSSLMYTLLGGNYWKLCLNSCKRNCSIYCNIIDDSNEIENENNDNIKYTICKILLTYGANLIIQEKDRYSGLNIFDICKKMKYTSILSLFNDYI